MVRMATQRGTGTDSTRLTLSETTDVRFPGLTLSYRETKYTAYTDYRRVPFGWYKVPCQSRRALFGLLFMENPFLCSRGIPILYTVKFRAPRRDAAHPPHRIPATPLRTANNRNRNYDPPPK